MTEPQSWPRAQRMPFVVAGERAQPHHLQAIAEYDEARGEATPRHHGPGMYTAAQINQAIEWWTKRAELEFATAVPERLSDDRLAEIRAEIDNQTWWQGSVKRAARDVLDLLAEVDRMRALEVPGGIEIDPAKVTPEQVAEWQAAWDKMLATGVAMYDLTPQPRDPDWWTPLRNRVPRSNDYPAGG